MIRTSLWLAVAVGLLPSPECRAQEAAGGLGAEAGAEVTQWVVDGGTYSAHAQLLQPQVQIVRPFGSAPAGPERNSAKLRLGLDLAWR